MKIAPGVTERTAGFTFWRLKPRPVRSRQAELSDNRLMKSTYKEEARWNIPLQIKSIRQFLIASSWRHRQLPFLHDIC